MTITSEFVAALAGPVPEPALCATKATGTIPGLE
jgi:hypothetical protein